MQLLKSVTVVLLLGGLVACGSKGDAGGGGGTTSPGTPIIPSSGSISLTAAGQSETFLTSPNFNSTLTVQAGSQYLIAIVNTDPSVTTLEGFSISGTFAAGSSNIAAQEAPPVAHLTSPTSGPTFPISSRTQGELAALHNLARNHMGMLNENRQIYARFGNPRVVKAAMQAQSGGGRTALASAAVIQQTVGTVNKVYVKNGLSGTCTAVDSIGARTVYAGQHVIVLADTNRKTWPDSLRPDSSFYQSFGTEYDQVTYPHIVNNIGNPFVYDASLSGIDKVTITITPVLNNFGGAVGGGSIVAFVNSCDFFPFATSGINADFSNNTEMFYSWIPGSANFDVADWEASLRATAAHETKHIVSFSDRIINNSPAFEEIWLEEGLAQESAEIWERNFSQATWKGQANFQQTVACEIDLGANAPCDLANNKPYALTFSQLPFLFQYLQEESASNSEGLGLDTPANYGAGWTIARWATDQYASSEATFIKSLIDEPQLTGLANLSAHTGQSVPLLLTYWNVATAIFQTPTYTAADVRTTIPSFNFADIFNTGQTKLTCDGEPCGLFTDSGFPVFPIAPISFPAGVFSKTVNSVPGTSASFFLLTGATAGVETIQLLNASKGPLSASSGFRVAILRVQ